MSSQGTVASLLLIWEVPDHLDVRTVWDMSMHFSSGWMQDVDVSVIYVGRCKKLVGSISVIETPDLRQL